MKKKKKGNNWLLIGGIALLLVAAALIVNSARSRQPEVVAGNTTPATTPASSNHDHAAKPGVKHVPAYYPIAPSRSNLAPTLDPEVFTGITREAYRAVKQIPTTIAQLPCYCHCDEGMGHKSLYSCYEDDHAAHCDVCVREVLMALRLEREEKLTPAQIRDRIVAHYSSHQ